uniref:Uncharacterized protein n=1 Tax=Triticum urartu TaxID=4572 RepID=A0A8R7U2A5_TRIUA
MERPSILTRSEPSPTSFTGGRLAVLSTTTRPPPGMSTSSGASRQLSTTPWRSSARGSGIRCPAAILTMPEPGWVETILAAASWSRSQARATNSVEKPVKMPVAPVSWKLAKRPGVWPLEVSPRKSTTSSAEAPSALCHQVTAPKGSARVSPSLTGITFSLAASGRTRPQAPAPWST